MATAKKPTTTGEAAGDLESPAAAPVITAPLGVDPDVAAPLVTEAGAPTPPVDPTASVTVTPAPLTVAGDEPPLAGVVDPRDAQLAALLAAPRAVESDIAPPRPARRLPRLTGQRFEWSEHGDYYLVLSPVYPRVVGENRFRARAGDVVRVPDDDRTHIDLANGYLIRQA